jgi:hypothetical protein
MGFGGFSWKRAVGISAAKARLSRRIGIPLTRSGRQRKLGRLVSGGGCLVVVVVLVAIPVSFVVFLIALSSTLHREIPAHDFGSSNVVPDETAPPSAIPRPSHSHRVGWTCIGGPGCMSDSPAIDRASGRAIGQGLLQ